MHSDMLSKDYIMIDGKRIELSKENLDNIIKNLLSKDKDIMLDKLKNIQNEFRSNEKYNDFKLSLVFPICNIEIIVYPGLIKYLEGNKEYKVLLNDDNEVIRNVDSVIDDFIISIE